MSQTPTPHAFGHDDFEIEPVEAALAALARLSYVCVLEASIEQNPIFQRNALWPRVEIPD